ncbi:MAG: response regulator transcription factor [Flavobacteriales bacterium]|nr:response regulator transcription factor [Flavobacteriales bacterium]
MERYHILLVEDDHRLSRSLAEQLEVAGYACTQVYDGDMALRAVAGRRFDAVLLDLSLPGRDGYAVCKEIRRTDRRSPIIVITAFSDIDDKMNAFDLGADDYLVKPVHFQEVLAKVRVFLKRREGTGELDARITVDDLEIDTDKRAVTRAGRAIDLAPKEYNLLLLLARRPGKVYSKDELAAQVWSDSHSVSNNTIEVYISFLRSKVDKGHARKLIHTRHGFGYTLSAEQP